MGRRGAGVSGGYSPAEQQKAIGKFLGTCTNGNQQTLRSGVSAKREH